MVSGEWFVPVTWKLVAHHGEPGSPDILLKLEILVDGNETGEPVRDQEVKEFAVPFARPPRAPAALA